MPILFQNIEEILKELRFTLWFVPEITGAKDEHVTQVLENVIDFFWLFNRFVHFIPLLVIYQLVFFLTPDVDNLLKSTYLSLVISAISSSDKCLSSVTRFLPSGRFGAIVYIDIPGHLLSDGFSYDVLIAIPLTTYLLMPHTCYHVPHLLCLSGFLWADSSSSSESDEILSLSDSTLHLLGFLQNAIWRFWVMCSRLLFCIFQNNFRCFYSYINCLCLPLLSIELIFVLTSFCSFLLVWIYCLCLFLHWPSCLLPRPLSVGSLPLFSWVSVLSCYSGGDMVSEAVVSPIVDEWSSLAHLLVVMHCNLCVALESIFEPQWILFFVVLLIYLRITQGWHLQNCSSFLTYWEDGANTAVTLFMFWVASVCVASLQLSALSIILAFVYNKFPILPFLDYCFCFLLFICVHCWCLHGKCIPSIVYGFCYL